MLPAVFDVVEVDDEFVTVAVELTVDMFVFVVILVFDRFMLVLFAVSPPQAAPNAAKPKSAESAIAFFMFKNVLLSSSKINLRSTALRQYCPKTLSIFGTNEMILR
jgi:hypothetical protein